MRYLSVFSLLLCLAAPTAWAEDLPELDTGAGGASERSGGECGCVTAGLGTLFGATFLALAAVARRRDPLG